MLPLDKIKVVSLEQAVAAPLCTRRLQLAGAQVFKIERPEGDFARYYDTAVAGQSAYFVWLNAGKKSVALDLTKPGEIDVLNSLIAASDILVQNLKPGALTKLGIDLARLHIVKPELISVSIAGFNPKGPGADRKAYDLLMQAESGLADITGSPDSPGRVGVSLVDMATGMFAYEAVLEAMIKLGQTGAGERINVSLFDSVAEWMAVPYLLDRYSNKAPSRVGLAHPGICPYGVFYAADGVPFVLSVQNETEWQRLCHTVLQDVAFAAHVKCTANEVRVANRAFVDGYLQTEFSRYRYEELKQHLDKADLAFAPVNSVADLKNHADFHTQTIQVAGEAIELPQVPGRAKPSGQSVPSVGEHTQEIREWLKSLAKDLDN